MENKELTRVLDNNTINKICQFVPYPIVIFNEEGILYLNDKAHMIFDNDNYDFKQLYAALGKSCGSVKQEIKINKDKEQWVELRGEFVTYNNKKSILAFLEDITEYKRVKVDLLRMSKIRALMLNVTQSILEKQDVKEIFNLILVNALRAIDKASMGTLFKKEGDNFKIVAAIGYDESINDFVLPVNEAFIYKATEGTMDRIINIPNLDTYNFYMQTPIKSSITVPIIVKNELYGLVNIDSEEYNAFDDDDEKSMEFIRNNIQIAISNHLLYKEKAFLANYDKLTRLFNRNYYEENFEIIKEKAKRYNQKFHLAILDIDDLKVVNDCFGHLIGDKVIKKIAEILKNNFNNNDIIARLGGDEFIGILLNYKLEYLKAKFDKIIEELKNKPIIIKGEKVMCSFSYGIAEFPDEGTTLNELISVADKRMYEHKSIMK